MKRSSRYLVLLAGTVLVVGGRSTVALASTAPGLGSATSFAVLAGTTVTNTGTTLITGDLGVSPGTAVTGSPTVNGTQHTGTDPVALSAKNDLTKAYTAAALSPCNFNETGRNLGGQTLTPGTYCQTTAPTLTNTLTLSGNGVFIFQIGSTLVTAPGATVRLINGAQPCNVFWQVGSSATLDTTTTFVGTIMALASISLNNGATVVGRTLAQTGQVSFISNTVTAPTACAATTVAGPLPTPSPTPSPTPAPPRVPVPTTGAGPAEGPISPGIIVTISGVLICAATARWTGPRLRRDARR